MGECARSAEKVGVVSVSMCGVLRTVLSPSACVPWVWGECAWGVKRACVMRSSVDSVD